MGQLSLTIAEVLPMVSDFLTVASFTVLMLTKLLLKFLLFYRPLKLLVKCCGC